MSDLIQAPAARDRVAGLEARLRAVSDDPPREFAAEIVAERFA